MTFIQTIVQLSPKLMIFFLASHRFLSLQNNQDFSASDFSPPPLHSTWLAYLHSREKNERKKITEPVLKLRNFLQRFKRRFSSSSGEGGRGGCCVMIKLTWSPSKTLSLMTSPLNSPPPLFHWQLICSQFFTFPLLNYVADNWSPQVMGSRPPLIIPEVMWSPPISPPFPTTW